MDEHCLRSCHGWKRAACAPRNNRSSPRNEKATSYRTPAHTFRAESNVPTCLKSEVTIVSRWERLMLTAAIAALPLGACVVHDRPAVVARTPPCEGGVWVQESYDSTRRLVPSHWYCPNAVVTPR
jgi:hypothetical protein